MAPVKLPKPSLSSCLHRKHNKSSQNMAYAPQTQKWRKRQPNNIRPSKTCSPLLTLAAGRKPLQRSSATRVSSIKYWAKSRAFKSPSKKSFSYLVTVMALGRHDCHPKQDEPVYN